MPCLHPLPAWKLDSGNISLDRRDRAGSRETLQLPCGGCLGCRQSRAREWAVRCSLEQQDHREMCVTTLTYEQKYKPPTLKKNHLQGWLKRLRSRVHPTKVRFFASGEYGEKNERPHFHAILYGLSADHRAIQAAWPFGHAHNDELSPEAIAYVAGYTAKKIGWRYHLDPRVERVDEETGEVYFYQPPFIEMSTKPQGIGGSARKYWQSWEQCAITNGLTIPVPRYLHEAWQKHATIEQQNELAEKKKDKQQQRAKNGYYTEQQQQARELNAIAKHRLQTELRAKL